MHAWRMLRPVFIFMFPFCSACVFNSERYRFAAIPRVRNVAAYVIQYCRQCSQHTVTVFPACRYMLRNVETCEIHVSYMFRNPFRMLKPVFRALQHIAERAGNGSLSHFPVFPKRNTVIFILKTEVMQHCQPPFLCNPVFLHDYGLVYGHQDFRDYRQALQESE